MISKDTWSAIGILISSVVVIGGITYLLIKVSKHEPNTFPSGEYLAEVSYINEKTGHEADYTLNVHVKDNRVIRIEFPDGGYIDSDDFDPVLLTEEGYTIHYFSLNEDHDKLYNVHLIGYPLNSSPEYDDLPSYQTKE